MISTMEMLQYQLDLTNRLHNWFREMSVLVTVEL